jgi:tripeptide aminopeptidase
MLADVNATFHTTFTSPLAETLAEDVLQRFLRYVRIDTQSQEGSATYPSTAKQLDLSRLLVEELGELGLADARLDEHGYVTATLPATVRRHVPVVGLIAHVDTSPEASGANVQPQVVRDYDGGEIVLPGDPRQVLHPEESPALRAHVGHDLVTSDGTTLLGADDKAGVAAIMAAAAYLTSHPEVDRGTLKLAFTPDEEVGEGTRHFDIASFGADVAYTLDASEAGHIEDETFSASSATITIRGHNTHPGYAKGKLVNSLKLAARLLSWLPEDRLSPETTEGREGYVHPNAIEGGVEETTIRFIVRDFDAAQLEAHERFLEELANRLQASEPRARVSFTVKRSYRNMKEYLAKGDVRVLAKAEEAVRRAGLTPQRAFIRGGTDGARLSEQGLPTPNLFTGMHDYHSVKEWVSVQDMAAAAATLVRLAEVWAEPE